MPLFHLPRTFSHLDLQCPRPKPKHPKSSNMSGSNLQGRWVASSIKEKDITKLRDVGDLTADILHTLPAPGQVIPTPEPNECVVFVPHFLRGLGLTLDPFVRGLLFYYGLDFHDLAPDAILHIASFTIVCEAFLHVTPHFGLWLKTFNVKPKMIEGRHAVCGCYNKQERRCPMARGFFRDVSDV